MGLLDLFSTALVFDKQAQTDQRKGKTNRPAVGGGILGRKRVHHMLMHEVSISTYKCFAANLVVGIVLGGAEVGHGTFP